MTTAAASVGAAPIHLHRRRRRERRGTRADLVLCKIRNQTYGLPETIQALETKLD